MRVICEVPRRATSWHNLGVYGRTALLAVACVSAGCALPSDLLEGRPCPCAAGWSCDRARSVCVREGGATVATTCWLRADRCDWSVPSAFEFIEDGIRVGAPEADNPQFSPDACAVYYAVDGDLFVASRSGPGAPFGVGAPLVDLNTAEVESKATVGPAGLEIFFSRASGGVTDTYRSRRSTTAAPWSAATRVGPLNAPGVDTFDVALAPHGLRIFFSRETGGDQELYAARRASSTDPFDAPRVISELSMPGWSTAEPSVTAEERVITFTRSAGSDRGLFYATREGADDRFGVTRSLPGPRLAVGDERGVAVSPDGCELIVRRRDGFYHQVFRELP